MVSDVVDLARSTPEAALVAYYRSSVAQVFGYLLKLTGDADRAADLCQEVYLVAYREMEAGRLVDPSVGWAIVVGRRRFLDEVRRSGRESRHLARLDLEVTAEDPDWDAITGGDALRLQGRLSDEHRAALVLRYVDDLPVADVARLLDRSPAATESLLARARRRLAQLVEEDRRG